MKIDKYKSLKKFDYSRLIRKKEDKRSCLIIGSFGANNLGDEAILSGQISELKKIGVKNLTVAGETPELISKYHGVKSITVKNLPAFLKLILKSDLIILGGGGIFCKNLGGIKGIAYQAYIILLLYLGHFTGRNISAIGIGFYKNQNKLVKFLAYKLLNRINLVTVRDFQSFDELSNLKVKCEIYKDTSFFMNISNKKQLLKDPFIKEDYKKGLNIGLSLVNHKVNEKYKPKAIREIKKFINKHPNATYWYYTLDSGYGPNSDYFIGKELESNVNRNRNRNRKIKFVFVPSTLKPELLFSSFQLQDFLITTRFHASMFAYRSKKRFAGISYEEKCSSFLESIGHNYVKMGNISAKFIESEFRNKKEVKK